MGEAFSGAHCRAARALLDMTQQELAERADVGRMTIRRFEASEAVRPAQAAVIRRVLEDAGCIFLVDSRTEAGAIIAVGVGLAPGTPTRSVPLAAQSASGPSTRRP